MHRTKAMEKNCIPVRFHVAKRKKGCKLNALEETAKARKQALRYHATGKMESGSEDGSQG